MKSLYKIFHTCAGTKWQDTERRILSESVWMRDQGHQVAIAAPGESPLHARAKALDFQVYALSFRGLGLGGQLSKLVEILNNEQPNILTAHGRTDGRVSIKAAQRAGVPCRIISIHKAQGLSGNWKNKALYKKLSHYVFTASDRVRDQVKQALKLKDMEVFSIPDGIARPANMIPRSQAARDMATTLALEPETRFIGLLSPCETRQDTTFALRFIKAFRQIRMEIPHHCLIPVTPEAESFVQSAIAKKRLNDRVHIIQAADIWDYLRTISCGILSPGQNAVPRALLKAMFASCPVAAARTEDIADLLSHGSLGRLFDRQDIDQLADALLETLTNPAAVKERVHAARELMKQRFTIDAMGRDIIRIYRLHQVRLERRYHQVDPDLYEEVP